VLVCRDCGRPRESNERVCPDCGADGWIADSLRALLPRTLSGPLDKRAARERRETRRVFKCPVSNDQAAEALEYFDETDWRDVQREVAELQVRLEPGKRSPVEWVVEAALVLIVPLGVYLWVTTRHGREPRGLDGADWGFLGLAMLLVLVAVAGAKRFRTRFAKVEFASSLQELCGRFYRVALSVPHPDRTSAPKASAVFVPVLALVPPPVWAAYTSTPASSEGQEGGRGRDSGNSRCPHCGHRIASPEERPLVCAWCGRGLRSLHDVHRMWWSAQMALGVPAVQLQDARTRRRPGASPRIVDLEVDLTLTPTSHVTFKTTAIKAEGHWFLLSPEPGDELTETDTAADAHTACGQ
jgi:hypothetical protein